MDPVDHELEAAATVLAGRALLRRALDALAPIRIVPAVLKGVLVSALAEGSGRPPRRMIDVDLLVAPADRARAEDALVAAGLELVGRTYTATTLRDHALRMDLDLHAHVAEPWLFRLDTVEILSRAEVDRDLFGAPVLVLDRHDLYAHLVAHFARGRRSSRDRRRLGDFAVVASELPMDPRDAARRIVELGLSRAARYALAIAAREGDPFAGAVVEALPPDRTGDRIARAVERWLDRFPGSSPLAVPALHALHPTIGAGVRALALHAAQGARSRARRVLQRT